MLIDHYLVQPPAQVDTTSAAFKEIAKVINEPPSNIAMISKFAIAMNV